jgi:hypothetical protein
MRIRYLIRLKEPILLEDHWPIPFMAGELRVVREGQKATAIEIVFTERPSTYAPSIQRDPAAKVAGTLTGHDDLLPLVRMQLGGAIAYLQCYFDIELLTDEIETEYTPETDAEKFQIDVYGLNFRKNIHSLPLTFDWLTRAIMAAEGGVGPTFEATLVSAARKAAQEEKFIDSFRYSFLLIESLFGEGKFKRTQLADTFKHNPEFTAVVAAALKEPIRLKIPRGSDTEKLLGTSPKVDDVIDHIVEKRGFYFHGNIKRKNAWKPQDQASAEALCKLALEIAMLISHAAAAPMFEDDLCKRHYENAKRAGAIMTMKVDFRFREPHETFDHTGTVTITVPGTVVTPKMAQYAAQQFLARFEHSAPTAALKSAKCIVVASGQKIFDIEFHVAEERATL